MPDCAHLVPAHKNQKITADYADFRDLGLEPEEGKVANSVAGDIENL